MLLSQDGANQATHGWPVREDATTSVRRLISLFQRVAPPPLVVGNDNLRLLNLNNNDLTGSIPVELGDMDSLTHLWLRDNSLSGGIPQELEDLNLTALHLSGNSFSGCIPSGLRDVETNDLNLLGLDYCTSPES